MAMQPQSSLMGANAATATPQTMQAPTQLNPYKMGNNMQTLQQTGMPIAQAVNKSALNPNNQYAKGGSVPMPPSLDEIDSASKSAKFDPALLESTSAQLSKENIVKDQKPDSKDKTDTMLQEYGNSDAKKYDQDRAKLTGPKMTGEDDSRGYAKGGDVHSAIKNMSLQDVIKLLASHPEVAGKLGQEQPQQQAGMRKGGQVERSHGAGLLSMNSDVGTYAQGGKVTDPPMPTYTPQVPAGTQQQDTGAVAMDSGGALEEDDITGYGPDGTPILQNADGTSSYGNVNDLLGRPSNAPTIGTGQTPVSGVSKNAANSVSGITNNMAKGGEETAPPGSLQKEVADDVPAKLSQGEFVFSADVVRYYGLRVLNGMMEHARQALTEMENEGNIRAPGDGKNNNTVSKGEGTLGQFMQDSKPNLNAYDEQGDNGADDEGMSDDEVSGILKECMGGGLAKGGACMATGGGIAEEDFSQGGQVVDTAKGGEVDSSYGNDTGSGDDSTISSAPTGGGPLMDYAKGGAISSAGPSLTPKKMENSVPSIKSHVSAPQAIQKPAVKAAKPISLPRFKQGGMAVKNMMPPPTQSFIGS